MSSLNGVASLNALRETIELKAKVHPTSALWIFDILINLDREQELIWSEGLRASSLLYYALRYPHGAYIAGIDRGLIQPISCNLWFKLISACSFLIPRVAICLLAVTHTPYVAQYPLSYVQVKQIDCTLQSMQLVFDVIASTLILWKMVEVISLQGGFRTLRSMANGSIATLIIQNGMQLGAIIIYFGPYSTVLNDYTLIISTTLVARFILDLKGYFRRASVQGTMNGNRTEFAVSTGQHTTVSGQWVHDLLRDFEGPNVVGARETMTVCEVGDIGSP
ncbi:hypothetical protein CPC08DRAFT_721517 [Agrocybe pediades]|nr:hypothetical protein CPC08DRAFT_721517 [Agrocybe pediades]